MSDEHAHESIDAAFAVVMNCNCKHCVDYGRPERRKLRVELGLEELSSVDLHRNMLLDVMDAEYDFYKWHPRR